MSNVGVTKRIMQHQKSPVEGHEKRFAGHELVFMMGEELKKPLTVIKALSETDNSAHRTIGLEAQKALRTIDNVLTYQRLEAQQQQLNLEPVHVGSTLTNVVHNLSPLSLERGCETEVFIQSSIAPVDAESAALRSGLESLWQAVLGMTSRPSPMTWRVKRTSKGIQISVVNNSLDLSKVVLTKSAGISGHSRQPFSGVAHPATDLVTAVGLFDLIGGTVRKTLQKGEAGFSVTLPTSAQLAFV
jgi:light-regulated signal transduction histidine kinase (bacteriophytochrome)